MNILRKTRKSKIKITRRRLILLIFSLIMTSFAWIAYFKILQTNYKVHINSWNISIYVDENKNGVAEESEKKDKDAAIEFDFLEMYPGMDQEGVDVIIKNNGETPSTIDYIINDIMLVGNEYTIEENAEEYRTNNPDLFCIQKNEKTGAGEIYTYNLIDEPEQFPFKFIIEHSGNIEGGAEGRLNVKAVWPAKLDEEDFTQEDIDEKNEIDSIWGNNVAHYLENNPGMSALQFKLKINATGVPRSSRFVLTQNLTPENYGDYVDYPVDLDGDQDTTNDWQILYEDNENVYIIADDYILNTDVSTDIFEPGTDNYSVYGVKFKLDSFSSNDSIEKALINKYMLSSAISSSNNNYYATAKLLNSSYWEDFVISNYAENAVGAPTIEMFVKSWNQKYIDTENYQELGTIWEKAKNGYLVNDGKELEISDYQNAKLYFPHITSDNLDGTDLGDCQGYWLASPSTNSEKSLLNVLSSGKISYSEIDSNSGIGIRPVVRLKTAQKGSITSVKNGINIWTLENP